MNEFWRKLCDITLSDNYVTQFADPTRKLVAVETYSYVIDGNTLPADITNTAPQTFDLVMDNDSDFVCLYFSGGARNTGAAVISWNAAVNVQITDRASGRTWFNRPAPLPLMAGQGGFPFLLTSPRVVKARTTLRLVAQSARIQSFSGFYFVMHGAKLYYA